MLRTRNFSKSRDCDDKDNNKKCLVKNLNVAIIFEKIVLIFMLEMFFHKVGEKDQVFDFLLEEKDL